MSNARFGFRFVLLSAFLAVLILTLGCKRRAPSASGGNGAQNGTASPDNATATTPAAPGKIGDTITNSIGMDLVYVPAGQFLMSSPKSELGHGSDEMQHQVTISRAFMIGATPVTQGQWTALVGKNPSMHIGNDFPAEKINWQDAVNFCQKLSQKESKAYRLPTEAEWEYACRAGTTTAFNTGDIITDTEANCDCSGTYLTAPKGQCRHTTTSVKQFKPNAWGLYDTHGNVTQWCSDWFAPLGGDAVTDPTGPAQGTLRVARGGCFGFNRAASRSSMRCRPDPNRRAEYIGFRVVLELP